MKNLTIILLFVIFLFGLSCDENNDDTCNRVTLAGIVQIDNLCSDPTYLSDHGYSSYDGCMKAELPYVGFSCMGL